MAKGFWELVSRLSRVSARLGDPIEFSIRELVSLVERFEAAKGRLERLELASTLISSLGELDSILRGMYGEGLPVEVYSAARACLVEPKCEVRRILHKLLEHLERLDSLADPGG